MIAENTGQSKGHLHPLTHVVNDAVRIFSELGFEVALGPEIETEYNNFDALNIPKDHPARDMHDTFWLKTAKTSRNVAEQTRKNAEMRHRGKQEVPRQSAPARPPLRRIEARSVSGGGLSPRSSALLRTHISAHQVPYMREYKPPFAMVSPGRVFRYEATDATHEAQFTYIEGLRVGKDINIAHLKGTLEEFLERLFGKEIRIRLRPSYFPFVEPGVEADMSCFKCEQKGCNMCKQSGWIEFIGAGMVHPNVLQEVGLDPRKWQGFAFGFGVDRLAMLKYGVDDIRLFYSGDLRLVNQF